MNIIKPSISNTRDEIENLKDLFINDSNISNIGVSKQIVTSHKLKTMTIKDAVFHQVSIIESELRDCWIDDVRFENCDLSASKFPKLSIDRAECISARMSGVQIYESTLKDVRFVDCKLDLSNFRYSKFERVEFRDCVLIEADFTNTEFVDAVFTNCELAQADFSNAKVKKLDLSLSNILDINGISGLKNATISQTQLIGLAPRLANELGLVVKQD